MPQLGIGALRAGENARANQNGSSASPHGFVRIASNGFGDPENSYAFSMGWLGNKLCVGTSRDIFQLIKASPPKHPASMEPWPVKTPANVFEMDLRAQLWTYDPNPGKWTKAYVSPMITAPGKPPAPRDIGYRGMAVVQGKSDRSPALYIVTAASSSRGIGAHVLRYHPQDGVRAVSQPGFGNAQVSTFRTLVAFRNRLYTSPAGSGRAWNAADKPCVYESPDPAAGEWRVVSEPHFGDSSNEAMYCMAVFRDHLYCGTLNSDAGFQVWKTDAAGVPPYTWHKVVDEGAGRGNLNQAVVSMCVFQDALYIGSGISNGGYDRTRLIGPAAGEVIRLNKDDSWDLVAGTPRATASGYKRPISGLGPGFGNPFSGYIWCMAAHQGSLYVGTFDSAVFLFWSDPRRAEENRKRLGCEDLDKFASEHGGFDLWRSADGSNWKPVSQNGFGNPYNYGIRTMASTPAGLFVGTANPFGPSVAAKVRGGWEYFVNPRGGLEVWLSRQV